MLLKAHSIWGDQKYMDAALKGESEVIKLKSPIVRLQNTKFSRKKHIFCGAPCTSSHLK